jgi:MarR family 2-MHQ and catechol resistance regulon transcriptional repressor
MPNKLLEKVTMELISIPPLIHRSIRRKVTKNQGHEVEQDITRNHFLILILLEEKGTLHVAEICQELQISKAQMTHLIDKLVKLDYVKREPSSSDRRAINISISPKGKAGLKRKKDMFFTAIKEDISTLSTEDLKELSTSLRRLKDILSKLN